LTVSAGTGKYCALQVAPANPAEQTHVPSNCATPCPEQVVAFEYWQAMPTKPALHVQTPLPLIPELQVPLSLHGVLAPPGHGAQEEP
jgi:hypothetical protein